LKEAPKGGNNLGGIVHGSSLSANA
jgi:hypothetical protein